MSNYIDQGALAEKAFAEYEFGDGVMVTDTSGWEYTTPGHMRTRKVYVETEREDDGPAPRWVLNFTVRFDPVSGALSEAYAMDEKGQIWGNMASQREVSNYIEQPASGKTGTFAAKYDQHAERNGQTFTVLGAVDPKTYDADDCGPMYSIRFADGAEIEAWPEEVESARVAQSPVDRLCQYGHNPT